MRHPTALLSDTTGVPESNLRLLTTILLAYPAAAGFRYLYANNKSQQDTKEGLTKIVNARNRYMALSGLVLAAYFSGWDMLHGVLAMVASYGLCYVFQKQRQIAVATVWIFNAAYLLGGYYVMAADDYDISWTTSQCILCLRLMGFSMDFMDGSSEAAATTATMETTMTTTTTTMVVEEKTITTQTTTPDDGNTAKRTVTASSTTTTTGGHPSSSARPLSFGPNTALTDLPSFAQMIGYCFYPSAFLIGPQFSFSLYQEWLLFFDTQESAASVERSRQQYKYVATCFGWAIGYLVLQQVIGSHYPTSYLLTSDYASLSPLRRFGIFWLAGKFVFTKYLGVWLLTEGSTALFGLGYEGQTSMGEYSFKGLANVDPIKYETATSLEHIIGSFNINTNMWSKYYVFKRLRWMGSKTASQTATLAFLAIWHGFHYGYFTTFLLEFLDVMAEGVLRKWVTLFFNVVDNGDAQGSWKRFVRRGVAWFLCTSTLFYAGVGFDLLSISSSLIAYRQVYYYGHVGLAILLLSSFVLPRSSVKVTSKVTSKVRQKVVKSD